MGETVLDLYVEGLIGGQKGLQNNFTKDFQAKIRADATVCNISKLTAICALCIVK